MKIMCEYSLQINLNGLEQQIICDLSAIMWIICLVERKSKYNLRLPILKPLNLAWKV
jgi:hypothetical protein